MATLPAGINFHVSRTHFLLKTVKNGAYSFDFRIPKSAQEAISDWGRALCPTLAVVATLNNKIVGFCRVQEYKRENIKMLCDNGVWVAEKFQRRGIATTLWRRLLNYLPEIKRVYASTTTEAGNKLFLFLREQHPHVMFDIY